MGRWLQSKTTEYVLQKKEMKPSKKLKLETFVKIKRSKTENLKNAGYFARSVNYSSNPMYSTVQSKFVELRRKIIKVSELFADVVYIVRYISFKYR